MVKMPLSTVWFLFCLGMFSARAEFREWTAADGRKLLAEFVSLEDGQVTIKRRVDGREFKLPLEKLSEADQAWATEKGAALQAEAEKAALRSRASNPFLKLVTGDWERHESEGLSYRFFAERKLGRSSRTTGLGAEPKLYPLVIDLHGKNGDVMTPETPWSANNFAMKDHYRDRPCFILVPQAPKENETWSGKNGAAVIKIAEDMIKHLPIDEKRIYILGYSMGAYGAFHLLATEPKFFAAAVPIAGGGNPSAVRDHRKVPVWVFHGAKDDVVDVERSRVMVEAMKKARAEVKYTELPDGDHGIGGQVYGNVEVHEWLFQQARK